jgi:hypothetical protein
MNHSPPQPFDLKVFILTTLVLSNAAFAADGSSLDKTAVAARAHTAPIIDGRLDDAAWAEATVIEDLLQIKPVEYDPPTERTQFLLMYDDDYLYIGARAFDSNPELITAKMLRQGGGLRDEDRIKIVLSPFNDKRSGYAFFINPNGSRYDGIYKDNDFGGDWSGIWLGESQINSDGWTTEIAIPYKTLSFVAGADWGINLTREIKRKQEEVAWTSRNRTVNPSIVGTLTGLNGLSQGVGLDVVPALSVTNSRDYDTGVDETNSEPSLDVFYKLTPSLNAALTINTDFSATEVDNRQVNLTRFGLFFPEKRDFFLRESDIFEFGGIAGDNNNNTFSRADRESGRPYFSRRIGLSSTGQPVDLDVGAKVSGRIGRWNIGTQAIRQAEFENIDATDIFVSRVSANIFEESTAGFIVTDGDPRSNLDNTLVGFDYLYRNTRLAQGRQFKADFWYQQTDTTGLDGDDAAYGVAFSMPNQTGWRGSAAYKEIQQNFYPAVGFISRSGIRQSSADLGYTFRPNGALVYSVESKVYAQRIDLIDGDMQSQSIVIKPFQIRSTNNDRLDFNYNMDKENLLNPFEISDGIIIPVGNYSFDSAEIHIESSAHRVVNLGFKYGAGEFFDGDIQSIETKFGWRPSKHFRLNLAYRVDDVELPQGDFTTRLASTEFEAVFSNTLSWVNLIQYDNVSDSIGLSSRVHWTPQAGRNVFFVVNHNYEERVSDGNFHSTNTDVTIKADYTFRF